MHIYCLTVSVGQESGHSLARRSALGAEPAVTESARWCSHLQAPLGENWLPKLLPGVSRIHFLRAVGLRPSVPCWHLAEVCPQLLMVPLVPCWLGPVTYFIKPTKGAFSPSQPARLRLV